MSESWKWTRKWALLLPVFLALLLVVPAFAQDAAPPLSPDESVVPVVSPSETPASTIPADEPSASEIPAAAAGTESDVPVDSEDPNQVGPAVGAIPPEEPAPPVDTAIDMTQEPGVEPATTETSPTVGPVTREATSQTEAATQEATSQTEAVTQEATPQAEAVTQDATPHAAAGKEAAPAEPKAWFKKGKTKVFVFIVALLFLVTFFTLKARRGEDLFIRRISGLSALEDAVGRATEMGRGVLFIPGIMDMDDIQTIAGVTILGHVAKKTAEYDTPLFAPMTRSFVMSVAQEVVKQSYLEKGRADAYRPDRIHYLTDDQFGYVAGVGGLMVREKPAACFYLGTFYAESLILAETGNSVNAIQIAGTAEPSQIPFFVAACDYTLIGEELFAASAYLSRDPREVGSLKGQDYAKILIIILILVGSVLLTGDAIMSFFKPHTESVASEQHEKSLGETYKELFR